MSGPYPQSPPPPPQPWMPPGQHQPMVRPDVWPKIGFWARAIGFLLLFIGTLIAVAWGSIPGSCFTSAGSCTANFAGQVANAILAAKVLWTIGLFFVGAGAGLKMHYGLQVAQGAKPEEIVRGTADRWMNTLLLALVVILLFVLLYSESIASALGL